jgi:hypothetical protein
VEIVTVETDFCRGRITQTTRPIKRDDMLKEKLVNFEKRRM